VTTSFPSATGETMLPSATVISGVFDGKMARWHRTSADVCQGQTETGEADTIFILENGATLANVIIGKNQAEGVHCRGTCTLINVWHEEVCEDAMTFKQASGTSYVIGGGARNADDKIMQFNGRGTVSVKYFYASSQNFGKVMRHCGNCSGNGGPRISNFEGIVATGGGVVVGINSNYGDKASLIDSCIKDGTKYGDTYTGVTSGEPKKIGPCPDGTACTQSNVVTSC
ncbi:polysaccharide lyase family 3 protein, partial [Cadophora sp. DSE1049]